MHRTPANGAIIVFPARLIAMALAGKEAGGGRLKIYGGHYLAWIASGEGLALPTVDLKEARLHLENRGALATFPELHPPPERERVEIPHSDRTQRYSLLEALLSLRFRVPLHVAEPESPAGPSRSPMTIVYRALRPDPQTGTDPSALQTLLLHRLDGAWAGRDAHPVISVGRLNTPAGRRALVRSKLSLHASALRRDWETQPDRRAQIAALLAQIGQADRNLLSSSEMKPV